MARAADVIAIAQAEVGATSGRKYWDWYWQGAWGWVDGWTTPYCACFVSWVLAQAGVECDWFPSAVAFDWGAGGRLVGKGDLMPGDAIAFDWDGDLGGDHVGIVKSVHDWGCVTIEGNTNGGVVAECQRPWSVIICGLRPYYDEEEEVTEADKKDIARYVAEYAYGDEDKRKNLNMYNTLHWCYGVVKGLEAKVAAIAKKVGA